MTRLIDDLLDVTRISRGKVQVQNERLDLQKIVSRTVEDYSGAFHKAGVALATETDAAPLWVSGDAARLAQIVGNLLHNASKFTPRGGHTRVMLGEDGGCALLRVQDDGAGIDREMLARLFEPFLQADNTLDRSSGGLGLGLALSKGLVEIHGGTLRASSDGLGKGAVLEMRLPLVEAPALAADETAPREALSVVRRVLVVEDNVDAAESLREAIELGGHTVEVAYSGNDVLRAARSFAPQVILCDIGLPGMNGYEVARGLRADPDLRETFLVALTGYAAPEDLAKAHAAGFDHHLAKPPSLEQIEALMEHIARQ
jgi:two-component system CheB/CheR fusion protein